MRTQVLKNLVPVPFGVTIIAAGIYYSAYFKNCNNRPDIIIMIAVALFTISFAFRGFHFMVYGKEKIPNTTFWLCYITPQVASLVLGIAGLCQSLIIFTDVRKKKCVRSWLLTCMQLVGVIYLGFSTYFALESLLVNLVFESVDMNKLNYLEDDSNFTEHQKKAAAYVNLETIKPNQEPQKI